MRAKKKPRRGPCDHVQRGPISASGYCTGCLGGLSSGAGARGLQAARPPVWVGGRRQERWQRATRRDGGDGAGGLGGGTSACAIRSTRWWIFGSPRLWDVPAAPSPPVAEAGAATGGEGAAGASANSRSRRPRPELSSGGARAEASKGGLQAVRNRRGRHRPRRRAGRPLDRGVRLADRTRTFTPPAPGNLSTPSKSRGGTRLRRRRSSTTGRRTR